MGDSHVRRAADHLMMLKRPLNLGFHQVTVFWRGEGGMHIDTMSHKPESHHRKYQPPDVVILACGTNDLTSIKGSNITNYLKDSINELKYWLPNCTVMYSDILPSRKYKGAKSHKQIDLKRKHINRHMNAFVKTPNGIRHTQFPYKNESLIRGYPD